VKKITVTTWEWAWRGKQKTKINKRVMIYQREWLMILIVFQTIEWRFGQDETSLSPVQNVVELLSMSSDNSSIHFRPFPSNKYSSKIHSTFYQCFAINSVGVVASAVIDVRAGETENVFHLQIVFYFTFKFHKNIN
jgi:hypothetical protein